MIKNPNYPFSFDEMPVRAAVVSAAWDKVALYG